MNLYHSSYTPIASSGGFSGAATHTMTQSLDPGTYYVRVVSDSVSDLSTAYTLDFSGTVFGDTSPDVYEENDSYTSASAVTDNATYNGYFDTINDADYYVIDVTAPGLLNVTITHASAKSFMTLFDSGESQLASSGGFSGAATHTLSYTISATGTYYIRVLSANVYDLSSSYTLTLDAIQ
jgi:hypothetical protein